jgi:uncharacterized membrane protein YhfC
MIAYVFTISAALILPILAGVYFSMRKKGLFKPFVFGALTFVVFQGLIRIPLIQYVLPNMGWYWTMSAVYPAWYALFLGVTAALFENIGRYIMMKLFMKDRMRYMDGVSFGLGHGGVEAVLLTGINTLATLAVYGPIHDSFSVLLAGCERLSAIIFHVAASLLVLKSIKEKKPVYLFWAILLHALFDSGILLLSLAGMSVAHLEIVIAAFSAFMLLLAALMKKNFGGQNP